MNYSFIVIKITVCQYVACGVNIYLYRCASLMVAECTACVTVCVCVFDIKLEYQQKIQFMCQTSVSSTTCCIKPGFPISIFVVGGSTSLPIGGSTWCNRWREQLATSGGSSLYQLLSTY